MLCTENVIIWKEHPYYHIRIQLTNIYSVGTPKKVIEFHLKIVFGLGFAT